jgi:hypothetical protein
MPNKFRVVDNFLSEKDLSAIKKGIVWNRNFPWYFNDEITTDGKKSITIGATHLFYMADRLMPVTSGVTSSALCPLLQLFIFKIKPKSIMRIKANFYPRTNSIVEHDQHSDYPYKHKGALFFLNTCDGFTRLDDGTKVESVENRVLFFDPSTLHNSSTCTDENGRFTLNVNYF